MDPRHVVVIELFGMVGVALHQPLKAVVDADDFARASARFERDRADHAVDARRRAAADKNAEVVFEISWVVCHDDVMLCDYCAG